MGKRMLALMMSLVFFALPSYGADSKPPLDATVTLKQISSEVQTLLVRERVRNIFDLMWRMREYGVTWQPDLCAPNDLAGKLNKEQLPIYAGMKLFDAIYAASFMQRQAVADAVRTIEEVQEELNLRSYADLSGNLFATLKKAAAEPESVNVQELLDQVAADYVDDIPALMSNPQSADYLIDALYGFTVEFSYAKDFFYNVSDDLEQKIDIGFHKQADHNEWDPIMVKLFGAFDRMNDTLRVEGKAARKLEFIELQIAAKAADPTGGETDAEEAAWEKIGAERNAIRKAVLTPSSK